MGYRGVKTKVSHYLTLALSISGLVISLLGGITFVFGIDKTNAIQEAQINNIAQRLERIEIKLDQRGGLCVSLLSELLSVA
jgi:hypothetical protein